LVVSQGTDHLKWEEIILRIDRSGDEDAPLHLKIKAYHDDIARGNTQAINLNILELRKILIPRPWFLKSVDQDGKQPFSVVRSEVVSRVHQYEDLILRRTNGDKYQFFDTLALY
jgi:hypothetical protein